MSGSRPLLAALVAAVLSMVPLDGHAADGPPSVVPLSGSPHHRDRVAPPLLAPAPRFPTTPTGAIEALADAYETMSLPTLRGLLAGDFHFHTSDEDMARLIDVDRARELQVAGAIFNGLVQRGEVIEPAADSIAFRIEGLSENADPEHPDSMTHYRTVVAAHSEGDIYLPGDKVFQTGTQGVQVFYVVRGDAAVLAGAQSPDSTRWYIRRWFEDIEALVASLGGIEGDCDQPDSTLARTAAALAFGIHPLGNPACPTLDISCDLPRSGPAQVEVFDVMGRRMCGQTIDVAAPGTVRIQAGAGTHLAPGAYWISLSQAGQHQTRMVVVAR